MCGEKVKFAYKVFRTEHSQIPGYPLVKDHCYLLARRQLVPNLLYILDSAEIPIGKFMAYIKATSRKRPQLGLKHYYRIFYLIVLFYFCSLLPSDMLSCILVSWF